MSSKIDSVIAKLTNFSNLVCTHEYVSSFFPLAAAVLPYLPLVYRIRNCSVISILRDLLIPHNRPYLRLLILCLFSNKKTLCMYIHLCTLALVHTILISLEDSEVNMNEWWMENEWDALFEDNEMLTNSFFRHLVIYFAYLVPFILNELTSEVYIKTLNASIHHWFEYSLKHPKNKSDPVTHRLRRHYFMLINVLWCFL